MERVREVEKEIWIEMDEWLMESATSGKWKLQHCPNGLSGSH